MIDSPDEAYLKLEIALVAYLQYLQASAWTLPGITGNPLGDVKIYPAHGDKNLDNVVNTICVKAVRSDTQPYWQAGIEVVEVETMIETKNTAQDNGLVLHKRRILGVKTAYDLRNFPLMRAWINPPASGPDQRPVQGFQITGWASSEPPIQDGYSAKDLRRQCMFRNRSQCGLML